MHVLPFISIEYRSDDVTIFFFFCISAFWIPCLGGAWWKNIHSPNLVGNRFMGGPRYGRMNTYLAPLKSVYIGLVPNSYEPGQFTLISMGLIRYSCGPYLGPTMNRFMSNLVCGGFFIMLYRNMVMKNAEMQNNFFLMTSTLRYSIYTERKKITSLERHSLKSTTSKTNQMLNIP